ncbi:MAG: hypothetical protein AAFV07_07555 [Bacteroidota bacterium]
MPSLRKPGTRFFDHLINAVLIFLSVWLAFWMNERSHQKREARKTEAFKCEVLAEFRNTQAILTQSIPYHQSLYEGVARLLLEQIDTLETFSMSHLPEYTNGIQRDIITNNTWRLLNSEELSLDLKLKLWINHLFEQQQFVTGATEDVVDHLGSREMYQPDLIEQNYIMLGRLLVELYWQERTYLENLEKGIELLEADLGEKGCQP